MSGDEQGGASRSSTIETVPVCGLPVAVLDYERAVDQILTWAAAGKETYAVEAASTHVVALSHSDAEFGKAMARFDLVCPDGMPLVWAVNHSLSPARRMKDRVYGPNLMLRTIETSQSWKEIRHFFLGGKESTLEKLQRRFETGCPDATMAGSYSPPFGDWPEDEIDRICGKIAESGSNVIWVGLGCPKQEKWIAQHKDRLPPGVYLGVGAAFAFHAGEVRQAPALIQRAGLEWAYRVIMEPRRLWRRYLVNNTRFIKYWLTDAGKED